MAAAMADMPAAAMPASVTPNMTMAPTAAAAMASPGIRIAAEAKAKQSDREHKRGHYIAQTQVSLHPDTS
jgi:hypothetical protein